MSQIGNFFDWLFNDRTGVLVLIVGGILLFLIISIVLERKTRKLYHNHEKSPDDWDLFDDSDDESGWSEFDEDNH
jgi:hypothetical protein